MYYCVLCTIYCAHCMLSGCCLGAGHTTLHTILCTTLCTKLIMCYAVHYCRLVVVWLLSGCCLAVVWLLMAAVLLQCVLLCTMLNIMLQQWLSCSGAWLSWNDSAAVVRVHCCRSTWDAEFLVKGIWDHVGAWRPLTSSHRQWRGGLAMLWLQSSCNLCAVGVTTLLNHKLRVYA